MRWDRGYSASYYMTEVDPATWRDIGAVNVEGGSIKCEATGLRNAADIECNNYGQGSERWIRVYLDARQAGGGGRIALFTGLATSPSVQIDGKVRKNQLTCYSVLKPADDIYLSRGWYVPAGISGANAIQQLLSVTPAPVDAADGSPTLVSSIVAEDGETRLTMVDKILDAIGWRLRISGNGTIEIVPQASGAQATMSADEYDVIEPQITVTADWYSCPNVFMAVNGILSAIARDDSQESPLSTVNRGREVWKQETNCVLADGETIADYAQRRLKEEQSIAVSASYYRRYIPDVVTGDMVRLHYPEQRLDGLYRITSQSVELGYGARTSETVTQEER